MLYFLIIVAIISQRIHLGCCGFPLRMGNHRLAVVAVIKLEPAIIEILLLRSFLKRHRLNRSLISGQLAAGTKVFAVVAIKIQAIIIATKQKVAITIGSVVVVAVTIQEFG